MKPNPTMVSLIDQKRRAVVSLIDEMRDWLNAEARSLAVQGVSTVHVDRVRDGGAQIYALCAQIAVLNQAVAEDKARRSKKP